MARDNLVIVGVLAAVAAVVFGLFGFGGGNGGGGSNRSGSRSSGSGGDINGFLAGVVQNTPLPDGVAETDLAVSPMNAVTDGSVWQGPDPLNLAPGEEGRGDLIGPINPGNIPQEGPVYVGPDPLNLKRFTGGN